MNELFIVVGLKAKPGKIDQLREDLIAVVEPSRAEAGSIRYELFEDNNAPGTFVFVEQWASEELRNKHHNEGAHIQYFHANGAENIERTEFAHILKRIA